MNDCPLPPGSKVIGYLRVSGEVQKEKGTIAGQVEELERYIGKHRLTLLHPPFIDEAKPGSSTAPRDGFQDMIGFAHQEPRPCDGIIFWSWSRFARDQDDAHFFKSDLRRRGYVLISLSDEIPQGTEFDYVMEALIHWKDQQYLGQLSRNTKRGLHLLARHGYATGGFPPRGYKAKHIEVEIGGKKRRVARWVPDPEWAPLVQQAWEMRATGASYQEILDKTSIYASRNSLVTHFRNKAYLGYQICGEIEFPDAHEPLITQELWDKVEATLYQYQRPPRGSSWPGNRHPRRYKTKHLLSGLVRCAYCGAAIIGRTCNTGRHQDWRYYLCGTKNRKGWDSCPNRTIPAERLEAAVLDVVTNKLLTPDFVTELVGEINAQLNSSDSAAQIAHLQSRIHSLSRSIANLIDLAEKVGGTEEVLGRLKQRKDEKNSLEQQVQLLEVRDEPIQVPREIVEELLAELREPLANGTLPAQRRVLENTVDRIIVERNRAELHYQFPCANLYKVPPARLERAHTASEAAALSA
jgi:site-specific DNA recombinase